MNAVFKVRSHGLFQPRPFATSAALVTVFGDDHFILRGTATDAA